MDRKSISRGSRLSAAHALCLQGTLLCKKLINKQSGSVIIRPVIERGYQQWQSYQPPTDLIECC